MWRLHCEVEKGDGDRTGLMRRGSTLQGSPQIGRDDGWYREIAPPSRVGAAFENSKRAGLVVDSLMFQKTRLWT